MVGTLSSSCPHTGGAHESSDHRRRSRGVRRLLACRARRGAEYGRHLVRELRRARPRRRISSRASPRSTTSSIRSQRERSSARRPPIRTSHSRTGARRCRTTTRSGTSRICRRREPHWPSSVRRPKRGQRKRRRRARRHISLPWRSCSAKATRTIATGATRSRWSSCTRSIRMTSMRPASTRSLCWARRTRAATFPRTCGRRRSWRKCSSAIRSIPAPRTT